MCRGLLECLLECLSDEVSLGGRDADSDGWMSSSVKCCQLSLSLSLSTLDRLPLLVASDECAWTDESSSKYAVRPGPVE